MTQHPTQNPSFTETLWAEIQPLFDEILSHPFIEGLTDGRLQQDAFRFYIVQDALYLREFARALSIAAAKAPDEDAIIMFNEHAAGALQVEQSLHAGFFSDFGLSKTDVRETSMVPTNLAYTSYMLSVAYGRPFHELLATVLPCYWIYWEVGKQLKTKGSKDPLYQRWIDAYSSEEYGDSVKAILEIVNQSSGSASPSEIQRMKEHFRHSARYEWMFWESAYQQQSWPPEKK